MAKKFFVSIFFFTLALSLSAQQNSSNFPFELTDKIPVDKAVTIGKLTNGLTYYIHPNKNPNKFAEVKLVVKAGSIQEDDDQLGLAHFLSHLALSGTKNFSKTRLVDFFNSVNMKYGADLTSTASFEGTIYSLQIPTDTADFLQKSLDILKDWATNITIDQNAIDKERAAIIEEINSGLDATTKIFQKQVPYLFKNSRYADRITFGKKEILQSFTPETLKRFYSDWYRPNLMGLIIVGDVNKNQVEELIKNKFADLKNPLNEKPFIEYQIPEHKDTLVSVLAEKDVPAASLLIHHEFHSNPDLVLQDLRNKIPVTLITLMFNQRMAESKLKQDFPMTTGSISQGIFVANNSIFTLEALGVKENKYLDAVDYLLTAFEKARRFGFKENELIRAKGSLLRAVQFESIERNDYQTNSLATKYTRNFFLGATITGIDFEFEFNRKYLQSINLAEVNRLIPSLLPENNLVVTLSMPAKDELKIPTEAEILKVMRGIKDKEIFELDEELANRPLLTTEPVKGTIKSKKEIKEIGAIEWTLSNGAKVIYKQTDFKLDEILMLATSPGGTSLVKDEDFNSARLAPAIVENCGVGNFTRLDLKKYLYEKHVSVSPFIDELSEGLSGKCSPFDLETMMKLIQLYFTSPRKDEAAFEKYRSSLADSIADQNLSSTKVFRDSVNSILYNRNPRKTSITKDVLEKVELDKSIRIYKERFANAGDFTFFFVGSITKLELQSYVEKYIASLPSLPKKEAWDDNKISYSQGTEKKVYFGSAPNCLVQIIYNCNSKYSFQNNVELNSLQKLLSIKLLNVAPYNNDLISNLSVYFSSIRFPKEKIIASIKFQCKPENIGAAEKIINIQLESLKQIGVTKTEIEQTRKSLKKENENDLKQNGYWLQMISSAYFNGYDPQLIVTTNSLIDRLSSSIMQKWVKKIFKKNNYVKVTLYPASRK